MKVCSWCKKKKPYSEFYPNKITSDGYGSWCKRCDTQNRREQRQENKKKLVEYFGGKCVICGYSKYYGALEFHRLNPDKKDLSWERIMTKRYDFKKMLKEAKKCLLICSNCHREIHAGIVSIKGIKPLW